MSDEHTVRTSEAPDEVQLWVVVVPLLLSAFLVAAVLVYRCRAYRLRRARLAEERQVELAEIAGDEHWSMADVRSCEVGEQYIVHFYWGRKCTLKHEYPTNGRLAINCMQLQYGL